MKEEEGEEREEVEGEERDGKKGGGEEMRDKRK